MSMSPVCGVIHTCVSIQPQLVNLFIHDGGVAHEHIQLHSHLCGGKRVQANVSGQKNVCLS